MLNRYLNLGQQNINWWPSVQRLFYKISHIITSLQIFFFQYILNVLNNQSLKWALMEKFFLIVLIKKFLNFLSNFDFLSKRHHQLNIFMYLTIKQTLVQVNKILLRLHINYVLFIHLLTYRQLLLIINTVYLYGRLRRFVFQNIINYWVSERSKTWINIYC